MRQVPPGFLGLLVQRVLCLFGALPSRRGVPGRAMAPGVAAASAGGERCCASELEREELAGLTAPRQWYCLVRVETSCDGASEGAFTAATEEDAETLAGLLTPQQALAARSPALCVEEADSPEQSGSTSRPASAAKPGGPCDHCGTSGAPHSRPTSEPRDRRLRHPRRASLAPAAAGRPRARSRTLAARAGPARRPRPHAAAARAASLYPTSVDMSPLPQSRRSGAAGRRQR